MKKITETIRRATISDELTSPSSTPSAAGKCGVLISAEDSEVAVIQLDPGHYDPSVTDGVVSVHQIDFTPTNQTKLIYEMEDKRLLMIGSKIQVSKTEESEIELTEAYVVALNDEFQCALVQCDSLRDEENEDGLAEVPLNSIKVI